MFNYTYHASIQSGLKMIYPKESTHGKYPGILAYRFMKMDDIEAAERRRILVLAPDRLLEHVDLDFTGFAGKLLAGDEFTAACIIIMQKAHGERR